MKFPQNKIKILLNINSKKSFVNDFIIFLENLIKFHSPSALLPSANDGGKAKESSPSTVDCNRK